LPPSRIIQTHAQLLSEKKSKYSKGKLKSNSSTDDVRLRLETRYNEEMVIPSC
jgi:hypothetical protein